VLVGFTGYQALKARTALQSVAADFETLSGQLSSGDLAGARRTLGSAQRNAGEAADNTHGPGWWLSSRLPSIGPNVDAVRTIAGVSDRIASGVLPDVLTAAETLNPAALQPVDGRIALGPIRRSAPAVMRASKRLSADARDVEGIDLTPLAPQIAGPVEQLQLKIADADRLADRASRAVRLLPDMLGGDGTRRYLFLFQNNAEIRATGGIPGSFATITARDGRISLGQQDDAVTLGGFDEPPTALTGEERRVFGDAMGLFPQSVNFTPDFPRSAQLIAGMAKARTGRTVDGVVSVDPIALSYLLRGTGPVETARGRTLTPDDAVRLLLSDVYADIPDPARQNDFFDAAADDVFDAVASGAGDARSVLENLATAASQRRLLVWSAAADEQRLLQPTAVGGALVTRSTADPQVGVYLNAAQAYKLDYYLDYSASVQATRCVGTRQELTVTMQLTSRVPRQGVRSLSTYVAPRSDIFGRGTIVDTVFLYAPVGGTTRSLTLDGEKLERPTRMLDGRPLVSQSVALKPGQSHRLVATMLTGPRQTGDPDLRVTPGVRGTGVGTVSGSACS
jgi:hypothetical protein